MTPFDRLYTIMTKPLVMALYFGLIAVLFFYLDKPIAYYFYVIDLRNHIPILNFLTRLGLGGVYVPTFLVLALCFRFILKNPMREARAWFLLICVIITGLICILLKLVLGRARPRLFLDSQLYGFYGLKWNANFWSLPSGHTTTIMSVIFGLCILFPRYFYWFVLLGVTVALSRVFLSHHYLSDVLFAAYLALIEVGILRNILQRKSWLAPAWQLEYNA
ncbi:phosphatase PAP2 family protein [Legionella micdadei]|uniref:undecaprenyl-diphosphate phosphatase n=1 Tax=Legionella micdadei TaxID=451 RepID=A0A098GDA7_LEGMI|nr:phosphatase PAP2 family protein [Legionella micdadei]ARG97906.1 phosphatase PAP2 family protein [Legionella micdadei]ARG99773.1 phosphatase PAP2 family protein [Legionella micdadei]KTD28629.1 putative membrane-associated phospholipid phosphatase [Legionella micdadei]NSL19284.1 phosphatase PAP2 family protein [Legionella micdadei]CEG60478.1 Putative membrane-associated phospholipid phosphatase [Legionella micdadei]